MKEKNYEKLIKQERYDFSAYKNTIDFKSNNFFKNTEDKKKIFKDSLNENLNNYKKIIKSHHSEDEKENEINCNSRFSRLLEY